jgi:GntR family transcriptional regulator
MTATSAASPNTLRLAGATGLPKYALLRNALLAEIAAGRWSSGAQLPAEDELAAMSGLSLGTVQRSLRMLVDEGRLLRRHGVGTFVAEPKTPLGGPFQHFRFLDASGQGLLPIFTRVVGRGRERASGAWSAWLTASNTTRIDRIFSINEEFEVYVRVFFDANRFPQLAKTDPAKLENVSFKDLMAREYHQATARYEETMRVQELPDEVCAALKLKRKVTGSILEIVAFDETGVAIYFQDVCIPPNSRRLLLSG